MYRETLERVIHRFTGEEYGAEVERARDEYFHRTGKVFEDDAVYETRMTSFLEWYLLDRILWDYGVPPIRLYNEMFREESNPAERGILCALERSIHTLCMFLGREGDRFRVRDLFDDKVWDVRERRGYTGIQKGDVLDARIIAFEEGRNLFSDAFWFHPREVRNFILKERDRVRQAGRDGFGDFLMDLAYMKLKHERFRHVPVEKIYSWETCKRDQTEAHSVSGTANRGFF